MEFHGFCSGSGSPRLGSSLPCEDRVRSRRWHCNYGLMASITIRKLNERLVARLRLRAAHHGRSVEAEAREILRHVLVVEEPRAQDLAQAIRRHIEPLGGIDLALPQR